MRRLLKFLHTMGAIGMMGSMASMLVCAANVVLGVWRPGLTKSRK